MGLRREKDRLVVPDLRGAWGKAALQHPLTLNVRHWDIATQQLLQLE
jgi:hypothetical protein